MDPLKTFYVFKDVSVREKDWRGKLAFEHMRNILSHMVNHITPAQCACLLLRTVHVAVL